MYQNNNGTSSCNSPIVVAWASPWETCKQPVTGAAFSVKFGSENGAAVTSGSLHYLGLGAQLAFLHRKLSQYNPLFFRSQSIS